MGERHSRKPPTTVVVVVVDLDFSPFTRDSLSSGEGLFYSMRINELRRLLARLNSFLVACSALWEFACRIHFCLLEKVQRSKGTFISVT